jgi:hypothetical protein
LYPSGTFAPQLRDLAQRLRGIVFINKPALRLGSDIQRIGLRAIGGTANAECDLGQDRAPIASEADPISCRAFKF